MKKNKTAAWCIFLVYLLIGAWFAVEINLHGILLEGHHGARLRLFHVLEAVVLSSITFLAFSIMKRKDLTIVGDTVLRPCVFILAFLTVFAIVLSLIGVLAAWGTPWSENDGFSLCDFYYIYAVCFIIPSAFFSLEYIISLEK